MTGFLLDTNCISEVVRPRPERRVVEWIEGTDEGLLYLSVLTLGEIRKGVAGLGQGKRRSLLARWLDTDLPARFSGRILPIDQPIADRWGLISAEAKRHGKPVATIDGLLAATALHFDLTLVTRNASDFAPTRVPLLNLWEVM
ncbi:MAG: type II toxin-antitoxin system VapC family toxin [Acidobacteriaceae bacterium]